MSRLHPGAREELVVGPVLDQEAGPAQGGQVRPVGQRPQSGHVQQPGVGVQLGRHQRGEGGHHAADHARRDPVIERRQQQAAAAAAGEAEGPETRRDRRRPSAASTPNADQVVGQHRAGERLAECAGGLGHRVLVQARQRRRTVRPRWERCPAAATGPPEPRAEPRAEGWDATGRSAGCPRRRCRAPARRGRVEPDRSPGPDRSSTRSRSQTARGLASAPRSTNCSPPTERTPPWQCSPSTAGQAANVAGRAQQPGRGVGTVADRPAQPTDRDAVPGSLPSSMDGRPAGTFVAGRAPGPELVLACVGAAVGLGRSDRRRPVLVAGDREWTGQRTASVLTGTGPALPRISILGRRKIAWPGGRLFSRSHMRCQACRPSSVAGTDAVVKGGVR